MLLVKRKINFFFKQKGAYLRKEFNETLQFFQVQFNRSFIKLIIRHIGLDKNLILF